MSVTGVIGLFRANPQNPIGADGRMALADHLRELRARLLRAVLVLVVARHGRAVLLRPAVRPRLRPLQAGRLAAAPAGRDDATINGAGGPLLLQLKLCGLAAVVVTSPYWLYQIWGFIVPGLHANERRWTRLFAAVAGPLFVARRRRRLLRAAQGPRGADRVHARRR